MKPDLDSPQQIKTFVDAFYADMLKDRQLAPIFLDVAAIDLAKHLPLIRSYWEKLLLGSRDYQRHTMNIHRAVHAKRPLTAQDFKRWLNLFTETVDKRFAGSYAERAKAVAAQIASNMEKAVSTVGN
ncbi:group III truncated hemoglobin [Oceanicoccus sagamiensis]|uniref:Globin n=1 Tax=Oceanicoccus sagamiensis TaxID=716816 RepID=A0A1X9NDC1_9GAMM|nr:group III truncated hemoglobin [Oceanicoccus sagamiensis]ARN76030.1 globin [Oceanicoccus sagamiensis]